MSGDEKLFMAYLFLAMVANIAISLAVLSQVMRLVGRACG